MKWMENSRQQKTVLGSIALIYDDENYPKMSVFIKED